MPTIELMADVEILKKRIETLEAEVKAATYYHHDHATQITHELKDAQADAIELTARAEGLEVERDTYRHGMNVQMKLVEVLREALEPLAVHSDIIESLSIPASVVTQSLRSALRRARRTLKPPAKEEDGERVYPCDDCGAMRSKGEGGTTFTVCDKCWDEHNAALNPHRANEQAARQARCPHDNTHYEPDASGNNDSTTTCEDCEKIL